MFLCALSSKGEIYHLVSRWHSVSRQCQIKCVVCWLSYNIDKGYFNSIFLSDFRVSILTIVSARNLNCYWLAAITCQSVDTLCAKKKGFTYLNRLQTTNLSQNNNYPLSPILNQYCLSNCIYHCLAHNTGKEEKREKLLEEGRNVSR